MQLTVIFLPVNMLGPHLLRLDIEIVQKLNFGTFRQLIIFAAILRLLFSCSWLAFSSCVSVGEVPPQRERYNSAHCSIDEFGICIV